MSEMQNIKMNKVKTGRNYRLGQSIHELAGLMQSMKASGLLQPIGVVADGGGYTICYGNRRFLAASKLGWTEIPAVVHENSGEVFEADIMNLAENVQRKNPTLTEVGRFIKILSNDGLTGPEIAARLGVSIKYVNTAMDVYQRIPASYQEDIVAAPAGKVPKGSISMAAASAIINARSNEALKKDEVGRLFEAAKNDERFRTNYIREYAQAIKLGKKDFIGAVNKVKFVTLQFALSNDEHDDLMEKYVNNGPFHTIGALAMSILRGEKNVRINAQNMQRKKGEANGKKITGSRKARRGASAELN